MFILPLLIKIKKKNNNKATNDLAGQLQGSAQNIESYEAIKILDMASMAWGNAYYAVLSGKKGWNNTGSTILTM